MNIKSVLNRKLIATNLVGILGGLILYQVSLFNTYAQDYPISTPITAPVSSLMRILPTTVNVTVRTGESVKALTVISPTGFRFTKSPTQRGSGIDWTPQSIAPSTQLTTSVNISVARTVRPGTYHGLSEIRNPQGDKISIPVTVLVTR